MSIRQDRIIATKIHRYLLIQLSETVKSKGGQLGLGQAGWDCGASAETVWMVLSPEARPPVNDVVLQIFECKQLEQHSRLLGAFHC